MGHEFAVYSEHSDSNKPMQPGANIRVFNRTEVQVGESIQLEEGTGVITLRPGTYHITASSAVTFYDGRIDTDGRVTTLQRPNGAYARLRDLEIPGRDDPALAIGTICNASMVPSLIDTYLEVEEERKVVLDFQAGTHVEGLFLQLMVDGSSAHVFSRISIRRLSLAR